MSWRSRRRGGPAKKNLARNRLSNHTLSDETHFIINPMGSEYYDQDILLQVRNKTGCICRGEIIV